ncbi:MAG TPA: hypothetical protein VI431_05875 [Candidatus Acidoferrum sp.]
MVGYNNRLKPNGYYHYVLAAWCLKLWCISSTISLDMTNQQTLKCDGCGQSASAEHIARRLRRLEWATRYRPVHIRALLLGAVAPREDADYLYSAGGEFRGEAAQLLAAVGIPPTGKSAEATHLEFQGAGLFLAYILECPLEHGQDVGANSARATDLLREHLPSVASRIRRSLKPKSVILVTEIPPRVVQDVLSIDLGCPVLLDGEKPFVLGASLRDRDEEVSRFRAVLDGKQER